MKKIFFLLFILLLGNIYSLAEEPADTVKVSMVREIFNFHVVEPNVMRGSQPSEEGIGLLKKYCSVKTILSLRGEEQNNEWEKKIAEGLGMDFISIPMEGNREQGVETIEKCLEIISDKTKQPIFVHCLAGKDRTGMIFAAYRIKFDNWSFEDALKEMLFYGYDRLCCYNLEKSLLKWLDWRAKDHKGD